MTILQYFHFHLIILPQQLFFKVALFIVETVIIAIMVSQVDMFIWIQLFQFIDVNYYNKFLCEGLFLSL